MLRAGLLALAFVVAALAQTTYVQLEVWSSYQCSLATLATKTVKNVSLGCQTFSFADGCSYSVNVGCSGTTPFINNCSLANCESCGLALLSSTAGACKAICGDKGVVATCVTTNGTTTNSTSAASAPGAPAVTALACLMVLFALLRPIDA